MDPRNPRTKLEAMIAERTRKMRDEEYDKAIALLQSNKILSKIEIIFGGQSFSFISLLTSSSNSNRTNIARVLDDVHDKYIEAELKRIADSPMFQDNISAAIEKMRKEHEEMKVIVESQYDKAREAKVLKAV